MGGIYSLNEQEPTNFPPVVSGCVIIWFTTDHMTPYLEYYQNI
jgi:hypothetical protein